MRVSRKWAMAGFVLLISAGSWFFSQFLYAGLLLAAASIVVVLGLGSKGAATAPFLAFNLLVVVVTYGSALVHVARPDYLVDFEVLGQIAEAEFTTLSGLASMLRYSVVRLVLLMLALFILGWATLRERLAWRTLGRYLGLAGAVHVPCDFAISQPALNISIYDPVAHSGLAEAFALGYLIYPSFVYVGAQLIGLSLLSVKIPGSAPNPQE